MSNNLHGIIIVTDDPILQCNHIRERDRPRPNSKMVYMEMPKPTAVPKGPNITIRRSRTPGDGIQTKWIVSSSCAAETSAKKVLYVRAGMDEHVGICVRIAAQTFSWKNAERRGAVRSLGIRCLHVGFKEEAIRTPHKSGRIKRKSFRSYHCRGLSTGL